MDKNTVASIAKNKASTSEQLGLIAGIDVSVDRLLAWHQNASPSLLENLALSIDKSVLKRVAFNPSTPRQALLNMANNKALEFLLVCNPNVFPELLNKLSHSRNKSIRNRVVLNHKTPSDVLIRLAPEFSDVFFENQAWNELFRIPENLELLIKGLRAKRGAMSTLFKRSCPHPILLWIALYGTSQERLKLVKLEECTLDMLQAIARTPGFARATMIARALVAVAEKAINPNTSSSDLNSCFGVKDWIDLLLARHPLSSTGLLEKLSESYDDEIRKNIVMHPNVPLDLFKSLGEKYPWEMLKNPALSSFIQIEPHLLLDFPTIYASPACPVASLKLAAKQGEKLQQLNVLRNPTSLDNIKENLSANYFYSEAVAKLNKLIRTQTGETKQFLEAYMESPASYCMPNFIPLDRDNPSHRIEDQVIRGFPFTSKSYPWPMTEGSFHQPIAQINLKKAGELLGDYLGDGLLQVWLEIDETEPHIRMIPESSLSEPLDIFYPDNPFWEDELSGVLIYRNFNDLPTPRIEWIPMGKMFPDPFLTHSDWWEIDLELDYDTVETLSEQIDKIGIPMNMKSYFGGDILLRLGGYPDADGNNSNLIEWPKYTTKGSIQPEKLLLYISSSDMFSVAVTYSMNPNQEVTFDVRVSCDR
jgi:hypothetical protein